MTLTGKIRGAITVGYDRPLIAPLTPWQSARVGLPETPRRDWPPFVDSDRLAAYDQYLALIEDRPYDVFDRLNLSSSEKERLSLAVGLPELLCNVWADAVWSDPPTIEFPSQTLDDAWSRIDFANDWTESGAWESVFAAAAFGHSVVRLYRDESRSDRYGTDVVIEEIDPAIYFPVLKKGSAREIESVTLAWIENRAEPDAEKPDDWQIRELHTVENGAYTRVRQERRAATGFLGRTATFREVEREVVAGVDFLPFVDLHAKRWRGRFWGKSELDRSMTLFDEIDATLSNIAETLEYHGNPLLQVPASVLYQGTLTKGADKVIGIRRQEDTHIARYITYDGQLDAGLASLEKNIDLVMLTSEIPQNYFGRGEAAATQSGTSLKLQLQNFVKKAGRWQAAETKRFRDLSWMALRLEGISVDVTKPPEITHGSPLPVDEEQEARIETALVTAGLSSKETSIRKMRRVKPDEVEDEIARIEGDQPEPMPMPIIPRGGVVDPNADVEEPPAE